MPIVSKFDALLGKYEGYQVTSKRRQGILSPIEWYKLCFADKLILVDKIGELNFKPVTNGFDGIITRLNITYC